MINRSAISVYVKQPFIEWLQTLSGTEGATQESVNEDPPVFLLPEFNDDGEKAALLEECFDLIFENELAGWSLDQSEWPVKRDRATFGEWFDVCFHSMVVDLVDAPLLDDDTDFDDEAGEEDGERD